MIICRNSTTGFTLLELLIVIGILVVLSSVVLIAVDPAEWMKRARDSARLSDLESLDKALNFFKVETGPSVSFGNAAVVYISLPDTSAACSNLVLPGLPSGWSYNCVTPTNLQKMNGTGWIPVNLTQIIGGSPLSSLPVDPKNSASDDLFYAYVAGSRKWELTAQLESKKFSKGGDNDKVSKDGGDDPTVYETGTQLILNPLAPVGYWAMDEASWTNNCSALTVGDYSKNSNHGKSCPNGTGPTGGATGKVGNAGSFDGSDDYVSATPPVSGMTRGTMAGWVRSNNLVAGTQTPIGIGNPGAGKWRIDIYTNGSVAADFWLDGNAASAAGVIVADKFYYLTATFDGTTKRMYVDGVQVASAVSAATPVNASTAQISGYTPGGYIVNGLIDEVRIYNRALSADEIKYYYNISK